MKPSAGKNQIPASTYVLFYPPDLLRLDAKSRENFAFSCILLDKNPATFIIFLTESGVRTHEV
jgi:hypothetical protein